MSIQKTKVRLDTWLVDHHHIPTPETAQALIITGKVIVNNEKITKPGTLVSLDADIRLLTQGSQYVSRGGDKLAGAHQSFQFTIQGKVALDAGISTGGFTDYLLTHHAKTVIGIDVGYGQVAHQIATHPQVAVIERTNLRTLTPQTLHAQIAKKTPHLLPDLPQISLVVMDLSFISVTQVLPPLHTLLTQLAPTQDIDYIILIKPQFEAEKHQIGKGGIITDPLITQQIITTVTDTLTQQGFTLLSTCPSPITGAKGNQEYFFHLRIKN